MATIVSSKGQVVIPRKFRIEMDLGPGARVEFKKEGGKLVLNPASHQKTGRAEDYRGMIKIKGRYEPADFDVATLLREKK